MFFPRQLFSARVFYERRGRERERRKPESRPDDDYRRGHLSIGQRQLFCSLSRVITTDFQQPLIRSDVSLLIWDLVHPSLAKFYLTIPDVGNGISGNFPVFLPLLVPEEQSSLLERRISLYTRYTSCLKRGDL